MHLDHCTCASFINPFHQNIPKLCSKQTSAKCLWLENIPSFLFHPTFFFFFCSSTPPKCQVMNLKRNAKATPIFEVSKKKIKLIASFTAS